VRVGEQHVRGWRHRGRHRRRTGGGPLRPQAIGRHRVLRSAVILPREVGDPAPIRQQRPIVVEPLVEREGLARPGVAGGAPEHPAERLLARHHHQGDLPGLEQGVVRVGVVGRQAGVREEVTVIPAHHLGAALAQLLLDGGERAVHHGLGVVPGHAPRQAHGAFDDEVPAAVVGCLEHAAQQQAERRRARTRPHVLVNRGKRALGHEDRERPAVRFGPRSHVVRRPEDGGRDG